MDGEGGLGVFSEVGSLKKVLLHRPGKEMETLTPEVLENLLFEDIPWLKKLQIEHDGFADALRGAGCRVFYYADLLKEVLADSGVASVAADHLVSTGRIPQSRLKEEIRELLVSINAGDLADVMICGLRKDAVPHSDDEKRLSWWIQEDFPFYINPLPNLYFTRDPGAMIGEGMALSAMQTGARSRETFLLDLIRRYHPMFSSIGEKLWYSPDMGDSLEGGDVMVLSDTAVAVGASVRSGSDAIETLARRLFEEDSGIREVLVIRIPAARAYMHLDTVFTMVDRDSFTLFPGVENDIRVFRLTPSGGSGKSGSIRIREAETLEKGMAGVLGMPVRILKSGGKDRGAAAREQWNDSANTLAVKPGTVITYNRNTASNEALEKAGIRVLEIEGSELVRGRGGPRCMSMPLLRGI
ncbi:MAG: arginine deiminase [Spirochaetes bacterium]|nr:MAG: arginine deiminase [Spirochaetota bacterium]RKX97857.1 MAG: arginine deiminase [Spirochaetota bacterium]